MEVQDDASCPACDRAAEVACEYVDRSGQGCNTIWCADHAATIRGGAYCRRHAHLRNALHDGLEPPVLENRAASLVVWLADDVVKNDADRVLNDTGVMRLPLNEIPLVDGKNAWEVSWVVPASRGLQSVALVVSETSPTEVHVRVGTRMIAIGPPPWVNRSQTSPVRTDRDLRNIYCSRVHDTVALALQTTAIHSFL